MAVSQPYAGAAQKAPRGVVAGQHSAELGDRELVVFLIGMRVNRWRRVRSWWPALVGMPRMLRELAALEDSPLLAVRSYWSGRVFFTVQYWRSLEELGAYARDTSRSHAPAWGAFNRSGAGTADIGLFHETYHVRAEQVESLYGNMPPFGLAAATALVPRAERPARAAARRMGQRDPRPA